MAICITCGENKTAFLSKECNPCMDKRFHKSLKKNETEIVPQSNPKLDNSIQTTASHFEITTEGGTVTVIGNVIIWLSFTSSIISIFIFGKVENDTGYIVTSKWLVGIVVYCILAGLNGVLFGYLLSKVGKILSHLEALRSTNR